NSPPAHGCAPRVSCGGGEDRSPPPAVSQFVRIDKYSHRPVVYALDEHLGAEFPGLHLEAAAAALGDDALVERHGGLGPGRAGKAGTAALDVRIERKLADYQQL